MFIFILLFGVFNSSLFWLCCFITDSFHLFVMWFTRVLQHFKVVVRMQMSCTRFGVCRVFPATFFYNSIQLLCGNQNLHLHFDMVRSWILLSEKLNKNPYHYWSLCCHFAVVFYNCDVFPLCRLWVVCFSICIPVKLNHSLPWSPF